VQVLQRGPNLVTGGGKSGFDQESGDQKSFFFEPGNRIRCQMLQEMVNEPNNLI